MPSLAASSSAFAGRARVVPSKLFVSGLFSSNQLEVFVASFVSAIWAVRSAANFEAERSSEVVLGAPFEDAVIMAVLRRRFVRRPSSSVDV